MHNPMRILAGVALLVAACSDPDPAVDVGGIAAPDVATNDSGGGEEVGQDADAHPDPAGHSDADAEVGAEVAPPTPVCGDGVCELAENTVVCPIDCPPVCGNSVCEPGEDPECPDCDVPCGNDVCDNGEDPENCAQDCASVCGDGLCTFGEDPWVCPFDCAPVCGNALCEPGESLLCPQDCCTNCDDGVACTVGKCETEGKDCVQVVVEGQCLINGECVEPNALNPGSDCESCQPAVDKTAWVPLDGPPCDDGNACTVAERCVDGSCTDGVEVDCDDGNPCTTDFCDVDGACGSAPKAGPCEDGDECTIDDTCILGGCEPGQTYSCDDGLPCTVDSCQGDGSCAHPIAPGTCLVGGLCYALGAPDPLNPCALCDPGESTVAFSALPAGTPCDDGSPCTAGDACAINPSACVGQLCADGDPCTLDSCDAGGCVYTPFVCDDDNPCTADTCNGIGGCFFDGLDCDDGDICTTDTCADGACVHVPDDAGCVDEDFCTDDACVAGGCQHTQKTCDDGFACTTDSCNPAVGCVNVPNDAACDDGVPCTADDCVAGQGCVQVASDALCADGDDCTLDSCEPGLGCVYEPVCGAGVLSTNGDLIASNNVHDVQIWDVAHDAGVTDWRSDANNPWHQEAQRQLAGRSLVFQGWWEGPTCDADTVDIPVPQVALELPELADSFGAVTLELWVRLGGPHTAWMAGTSDCAWPWPYGWDQEPIPLQLFIHDGPVFDPGSVYGYCNEPYQAPPAVSRLDLAVDLAFAAVDACPDIESAGTSLASCSHDQASVPLVAPIPPESWIHIAIATPETGSTQRVYIDGVEHLMDGYVPEPTPGEVLRIAAASGGPNADQLPFDVLVDEVRFYEGSLSAAEILALKAAAEAGAAVSHPSLRAHWSFDQGGEPFTASGGARLSERSSRGDFPEVALVVASDKGVDVLEAASDGTARHWMRFGVDPWGRSLLDGGVGHLAGRAGFLFLTSLDGQRHHAVQLDQQQPPFFQESGPWVEQVRALRFGPCRHRLGCNAEAAHCLGPSSPCACGGLEWDAVTCRNRNIVDLEWQGDPEKACFSPVFEGADSAWQDIQWDVSPDPSLPPDDTPGPSGPWTVVAQGTNGLLTLGPSDWSAWSFETPEVQPGTSVFSYFGSLHMPRITGGDVLVVARTSTGQPDEPCDRLLRIPGFFQRLWDLTWEGVDPTETLVLDSEWMVDTLLYAGSLSAQLPIDCGSPVERFVSVALLEGSSDPGGAAFPRIALTTERYAALVETMPGWTLGDTLRWRAFTSDEDGIKLLPEGPYTAMAACGGVVYVGTQSNGLVAIARSDPEAILATWSTPSLPDNEIRALDCSEDGGEPGKHRVLVGTPGGAVLLLQNDAP